jgi:hypothetical protein
MYTPGTTMLAGHYGTGAWVVAVLVLALPGCSRRIEQHGEADEATMEGSSSSGREAGNDPSPGATSRASASGGFDTDGGSTGYPPLRCPDGKTQCGDECVDLRWSEEHCGSCGHTCLVVGGAGECWEGVCPPTLYCARAAQGFSTCASVCAWYGESCVDTEPEVPGACGGEHYGLYYDLTPDFDCEVGYFSVSGVPGRCHDPIRWDLPSPNGGSLPGAVGCCCTQP